MILDWTSSCPGSLSEDHRSARREALLSMSPPFLPSLDPRIASAASEGDLSAPRSAPVQPRSGRSPQGSLPSFRVQAPPGDITVSRGPLLRAPFFSHPGFLWKHPSVADTLTCSLHLLPADPTRPHPPDSTRTPSEPCHRPHIPPRRAFFNRFKVSRTEWAENGGFGSCTSL